MSHRRDDFLQQFDPEFQNHIVEFGKHLTELSKNSNIIIFLARKAACLADCLDEIGLSQFHCIITSSRVLDMNIGWMKGKRVTIVDDALISGTTIFQVLRHLESNGIMDVKVTVLSVDSQWWNPELVKPEKPYFELNSNQTSQLCANIVQAISVIPRPYTIDYPLFKNIRIKAVDFHELSNSSNWIVYEATSSHQDKYNITNLTIIPSEPSAISFLGKIGLNPEINFLLKLRLYALKVDDVYWCQVLPIAILPAMEVAETERMFNRILEACEKKDLSNWFNSSRPENDITARLRLVQYYLGCQLGYLWHEDMVSKVESNIIFEQDFKNLNFLFPPPISDTVKNVCIADHIKFEDLKIKYHSELTELANEIRGEFDELSALHRLSAPFLDLFKKKEIPARELVKKEGVNVFDNEEYKSIMNRLDKGYSIKDLKRFIWDEPTHINKGKLVSYFLDLYIDKGVVVPITCIENGKVFRAFRHGEDVEFSENEIRLCMSMLHKFAEEYGSKKLHHTIIEKLFVLFVRIGIQKNFLTISTAPLSDFQSIGIRYYLHGAVVGSFDKQIFKVNMQHSLTNVLIDADYLGRKNYEDEFELLDAPVTGTTTKGLTDANLMGRVFGNLLKQNKPKITLDDLILMATIPTLMDAVGALSAEVFIFQGFYNKEKSKFFKKFSENKIRQFRGIRSKNAFKAINSGTWKFENFKAQAAWSIIQEAGKKFHDTIYGDVWSSFWPSMGKQTSNASANPNLEDILHRLADWLYTTRFYINLMEISLTKSREEFRKEPPLGEMRHMLEATKTHLPELYKFLKRLYDRAHDGFLDQTLKSQELYEYCYNKIEENFQFSRQLLAEVDSIASNFGKIDRVAFCEHVVLVDFKKFNKPFREVREILEKVINDVRSEAKGHDGTQFFEIPHQYSAIKTGSWVCCYGKNARRWLLHFGDKLIKAMEDTTELKLTYFLNLGFFRICKRISSNEYQAPLFWDIAKSLLRKKYKLKDGHELIYFTGQRENQHPIESEIKNELPSFSAAEGGQKEIDITDPYSIRFISNHYVSKPIKPIKNLMDVGIITIVTPELLAVTDAFKANNSYREINGSIVARKYRAGTLKDKDGKDLNVVAIQALEQGNRSIVSIYNALADEFNPNLIVLLGIAGSIKDKVNICDVVIADSIYYYDRRSETEEGAKRNAEVFKIGAYATELIQNFQHAVRSEEPEFKAAEDGPGDKFKTYVGPIGTGEAVIKYKDAEVREWLNTVNPKVLAVETEAGGFAQQFYEDSLNYSRRAKGILILRGISDKADVAKDDKYRLASSKNAMTVLMEILKANSLF